MWRDEAYLLDMLLAARRATKFLGECDLACFERDELRQSAILHQLQIIGEAASKISREYRADHEVIDWNEIVGMRCVLVHDYRHIDLRRIWHAAAMSAPLLCEQLEPLIPAEEDD